MQAQTKPEDILGDSKTQKKSPVQAAEKKTYKPRIGQTVLFFSNGENEITASPAIITKVRESGAADLNIFKEGFLDFRTRVPYSEEPISGAYSCKWPDKN